MTTIQDIARKSKHSVSTVSRVINDSGYVSAATRAEIEAVIKQTNYVPNAIGRELRLAKSQVIGVVMPSNNTPYFTQILSSIVEAATPHASNIMLLISEYQPARERQFLEMMRRHAVDALIFLSHEIPASEISQYQRYGQIVLAEDPEETGLSAAFTQRELSEIKALEWINSNFHPQTVAFFFHRPLNRSYTSRSWAKAYLKTFSSPIESQQVITDITCFDDVSTAMSKLKSIPDFIIANSDETAAAALQYCHDHNLPLMGALGQECEPIGKILNIPTINNHFDELGNRLFAQALSPNSEITAIPATFIPNR